MRIEFVKVKSGLYESVSVAGLRVGSRSTCGASESSINVIRSPSACLSSITLMDLCVCVCVWWVGGREKGGQR